MSILLFRFVHRSKQRYYGAPEKRPLGLLWRLAPFFVVKGAAKLWCPTKRVNNTMYVEAFPNTFISIGPAK